MSDTGQVVDVFVDKALSQRHRADECLAYQKKKWYPEVGKVKSLQKWRQSARQGLSLDRLPGWPGF